MNKSSRWVKSVAFVVATMCASLGLFALPSAAMAEPAATPAMPESAVGAEPLPTWQINGVVWSSTTVGNTAYVTGSFTEARPPGVAVGGAGSIPANNIFAFDVTTGNPVSSFNHSLNGQGLVIRASADGSRVYVGGDFTTVDGVARGHVAAFNTADNSLVPNWAPNVGGQVRGLGITGDTVYVGGNFPSANGQTRGSLAAFTVSNGAMTSWSPTVGGSGGYVWDMVMSPDNSQVIVGGSFATLNDDAAYGMGALDATTGATNPWAAQNKIRTAGLNGAITSLKTDGTNVYGSGYSFGTGATFEGTFAASPNGGNIVWVNDCLGDTYDVEPFKGQLFAVSHAHDCSAVGGFGDTKPRSRWQKATASPLAATGTITAKDAYGWDFRGLPMAGLIQWYPDLDFGSFTPSKQAAWTVSGTGDYLIMGGEFPKAGSLTQQGLARYQVKAPGSKSAKPIYLASMNPTATSTEAGTVRLSWGATWDRDDKVVTYDVYRDGGPSIHTTTSEGIWYNLPTLAFWDTGLTPGATVKYQIRAKDAAGNVQWSQAVTTTVSTLAPPAYTTAVRADIPAHYWRLDDTANPLADSRGSADLSSASVTLQASGLVTPGTGISGTNANNSKAWSTNLGARPSTGSIEAWVRTTNGSGGRIIGFGDSTNGTSSTIGNDMVIHLSNAGNVNFNVAKGDGNFRSVTSTKTIRDGAWHHVAATFGQHGSELYVDGNLVGRDQLAVPSAAAFNGYWRLLADQTSGLANRPTNAGLIGTLDEVAVYPTVLTPEQIRNHVTMGNGTTFGGQPTDAYAQAVNAKRPDLYWRLNEGSGSVANDSSVSGQKGKISYVTYNAAGAIAGGDKAMTFNGASIMSSSVINTERTRGYQAYSSELWFKTTTTRGGKLIGFGAAASGLSGQNDRHVVMLNTGVLEFATYTGVNQKVTTTQKYNDGAWHHLVVTQGPDGMKVYVDGLVRAENPAFTAAEDFQGYWRIGGDATWGGTTSNYFAGTLDEVAVYPRTLTAVQVASNFVAGGGVMPNLPPTAAFTDTQSFLTTTVDGSASTDSDGTIANWAWNFGDGATATGATASHTYAAAGTYTVTLTVTDDKGASTTTSRQITVVANMAPVSAFTTTQSYLEVSADGSASSDAEGPIAAHAWDFGDGKTATGPTATHTYAAAGTYTVTLTVTDGAGATTASTKSVTVVANQAPVAAFTHTEDVMTTSVDGSTSTDADGHVASHAWDFGDGTTATGPTASHTYATPGAKQVTLTVTDDQGLPTSITQTVTVQLPPNQVPTASFTHSETGLSTSVDAAGSTDADGTLAGYAWTFGDGSTATGVTATHAYAVSGTYTVTLTVTDDRGDTATTTRDVTVVQPPNQGPTAAFTAASDQLGLTVDASSSTDPDGTVASFAWDFGDGATASGATATHTYAAPGAYAVSLTVTDNEGATATTTESVVITANAKPVAAFTTTANELVLAVDASSSTDADGTITAYAWQFGDGASATGPTGTHTYAAGGTYAVKLTVTDNAGATTTVTKSVTVAVIPPVAQDLFERALAGGWGNADLGGAWTLSGSLSKYSVAGGRGVMTNGAGGSSTVGLPSVSRTETEVAVSIATDKASSAGTQFISVLGRTFATNQDYRAKVQLNANGTVGLYLNRMQSTETVLASQAVPGLTYAVGDRLQVRLQVTGTSPTTLRAKVWKAGTPEPTAWQLTATDSTAAFQAPGAVGFYTYLAGSATGPVAFTVDDLWVGPLKP